MRTAATIVVVVDVLFVLIVEWYLISVKRRFAKKGCECLCPELSS